MGEITGKTYRAIRSAGFGSNVYGNCEHCNEKMSECFVSELLTERRRENGQLYYCSDAGSYGHKECLITKFGNHQDKVALTMLGKSQKNEVQS